MYQMHRLGIKSKYRSSYLKGIGFVYRLLPPYFKGDVDLYKIEGHKMRLRWIFRYFKNEILNETLNKNLLPGT